MPAAVDNLRTNSMTTKHHHHVVPACVLRNFTDDNGLLHCYDKKRGNYFATDPNNAFKYRNMYAYTNRDGKKEILLEDWFAGLEYDFDRLAKKLLIFARGTRGGLRKRTPVANLSDYELEVARKFFIFQFARTPAQRRDAISEIDSTFEEILEEAVKTRKHDGEKVSEQQLEAEIADARGAAKQPHYQHNQWLMGLSSLLEGDGFKATQSKGVVIGAVKNSHEHAFIIGDNPIIQAFPNGVNLLDPAAEIIMPIASDAALSLATTRRCKKIWVFGRLVAQFNQSVFERSDVIASRSKSLTLAFAN